jgi:DNA-directed RNA polymerase specialized sigma24 family protein
MFDSPHAVAAALKRYRDAFDPVTGSLIVARSGTRRQGAEPFRPGFLAGIEERTELERRMGRRLKQRERLLLVLWYVSDLQVSQIARQLQVSRVHCYRLRDKALRALCDPETTERTTGPGLPAGPG